MFVTILIKYNETTFRKFSLIISLGESCVMPSSLVDIWADRFVAVIDTG